MIKKLTYASMMVLGLNMVSPEEAQSSRIMEDLSQRTVRMASCSHVRTLSSFNLLRGNHIVQKPLSRESNERGKAINSLGVFSLAALAVTSALLHHADGDEDNASNNTMELHPDTYYRREGDGLTGIIYNPENPRDFSDERGASINDIHILRDGRWLLFELSSDGSSLYNWLYRSFPGKKTCWDGRAIRDSFVMKNLSTDENAIVKEIKISLERISTKGDINKQKIRMSICFDHDQINSWTYWFNCWRNGNDPYKELTSKEAHLYLSGSKLLSPVTRKPVIYFIETAPPYIGPESLSEGKVWVNVYFNLEDKLNVLEQLSFKEVLGNEWFTLFQLIEKHEHMIVTK